jgi:hypothetical protein
MVGANFGAVSSEEGWAMRHLRLVSAAVGFVLLALVPQSVGAAAPTRFPGTPLAGTFDAGILCPFQLDIAVVAFNVVQTTYFDSNHNVIKVSFTGRGVFQVTNDATGKTLVVNASGPGFLYPQPDGSLLGVGGGPGLIGLLPTDEGGPALLLIHGHETFNLNGATGQITNLKIVGTVTDLCAALA